MVAAMDVILSMGVVMIVLGVVMPMPLGMGMFMGVTMMMVPCGISLTPLMPRHQKTPSCDATPVSAFKTAGRQSDGKCLEGFLENLLRNSQISECRDRHVAADSGKGIDMENLHRGGSWS